MQNLPTVSEESSACRLRFHRPSSRLALKTLGSEIGVAVYRGDGKDALLLRLRQRELLITSTTPVIVDTAGRLN